ncbi:putative transcriptional regulator, contains HTHdomain [Halalkaliarchaeum sp. AArc-CO]|uniref:conditioned medium-induced protein 4 n=1 Tax=unclassified Halalkaliarchaeum TaxID=2678344 RepID=UPI00217EE908|nr:MULTISPECIES: conditioned medium-induced protein 4 [unclassified Halalkaliarchaeum]MDR5671954.1 conditioned medium-induced protein 4 [Halalkaliarchaeum sp. AArc-GB]UWG51460.1 putative transcriptional regulator, contains HTHdomain [Halalkaliarchaeum sp. AArc-CO]
MDEKTEELREIFIDATGSESVTEGQVESPGSLTDGDEGAVLDRVAELVGTMRERYEFDSSLCDRELVDVVRCHFDGADDDAIADHLGVDREGVFRARMDLHLVADGDRDAPFELETLKRLHADGVSMAERVETLDADEETVRRYSAVVDAELESTRANDRFRDEFRELLTDADIEGPLAQDAHEDGLEEATEDIETDVSF